MADFVAAVVTAFFWGLAITGVTVALIVLFIKYHRF